MAIALLFGSSIGAVSYTHLPVQRHRNHRPDPGSRGGEGSGRGDRGGGGGGRQGKRRQKRPLQLRIHCRGRAEGGGRSERQAGPDCAGSAQGRRPPEGFKPDH